MPEDWGPKWLVVGGSGLLGSNFAMEARRAGPVAVTFLRHPVRFDGCVSLRMQACTDEEVFAAMKSMRPDWILNATGCTSLETCEANPSLARSMNAEVPRRLATAARAVGAGFVHVSSDGVFDGTRGNYTEQDSPVALNQYAASKILGEEMALDAFPDALVIRTNFYGWSNGIKPSYTEWLRDRASAGEPFPVFSDVRFNALLVNTLAQAIMDASERGASGLLHLGNSTPCSKLEFARSVDEEFAMGSQDLMRPVSVEDLGSSVKRPHDMTLNCARAEQLLGRPMPSMKDDLARLRELQAEGYIEKLKASVQGCNASEG